MEQIYTIPVNEAFDQVRENKACGCPLCVLYKKLEENELDIILGASMMEPDIRMRTNEEGFCLNHYDMMLTRKRMLGMGLILESHLDEVKKRLNPAALFVKRKGKSMEELSELEESCYVCGRIKKNLDAMTATVVYLYETEEQFREKLCDMPYFCLPHYRAMMEYAMKKMSKNAFGGFYKTVLEIENNYIDSLRGDVSWFCKKFDYRYDSEPWYNSKDSVQRTVKFLSGDFSDEQTAKSK